MRGCSVKKAISPATSQLAPKHGVAGCINAMELKDGLG
jgi:hypothetical protein